MLGRGFSTYSEERAEGFQHQLHIRGFSKNVFQLRRMKELEGALKDARLPLGVFCATDGRAGDVAQVCRSVGLGIPQDVGLIGCDNDELGYLRAGVPLSSVDPNGGAVGWAAAKLLKDILAGRKREKTVIIPPKGLKARQSTDLLRTRDPLIAQTLQRIRELACAGSTIAEIIAPVPASRSSLEPRFKKVTGRTMLQEIKRVRLEEARRLLLESRWNVTDIMERCGYSCPTRFHREFKQHTRLTPRQYRNEMSATSPYSPGRQ